MYVEIKTRNDFVKAINSLSYKTIAEVGVRYGGFSHFLVSSCPMVKLYAIDPWETNSTLGSFEKEEAEKRTRELLKKYVNTGRCEIIKGWSPDVLQNELKGINFDFVYIDGQHDYDFVKNDIEKWWEVLNPYGIIAGHDYWAEDTLTSVHHTAFWGLVKAVQEFAKSNNVDVNCTGTCAEFNVPEYGEEVQYPSWWIFKNGESK